MTTTTKNKHLDAAAQEVADARNELYAVAAQIETELQEQRNRLLAEYGVQIAELADKARRKHARLSQLIDDSKECFDKPRSREFAGIKFGLKKLPGGLDWDGSDDDFVNRIKSRFGKNAAISKGLVKRKDTPAVAELRKLNAAQLEKLGARINRTGDSIVIDQVQTEIEEMIGRYLAA